VFAQWPSRSFVGPKRADCMSDLSEVNEQTFSRETGGDHRGGTERAESGLTQEMDDRLTLRAAKWQRGRWETGATREDIEARVAARGGPTLKEKVMLKMFEHLEDKDSKLHGRAMRSAIQAEAQNQRDELHALNAGTDPAVHSAVPVAPDQIALAMDASIPEVAAG